MGSIVRRLSTLSVLLLFLLSSVGAAADPQAGPAARLPTATPGDVVINEVAWMGTNYSTSDEWIELYNTTPVTIPLDGWHLVDDDTMDIALAGSIPAHGYYLLERTDDDTIPDVPADWFGSFGTGLSNDGEALTLTDDIGTVIDTANGDGGGWPAGDNDTKQSMERVDPLAPDDDANWGDNTTWIRNGHDFGGNPIKGTPKARNSLSWPDLVVAKQAPPTAPVGAPLVYHIAITNSGPLAAPGVVITDTLPAGFLYQSYESAYTCSLAGLDLCCQAGAIPPAGLGQITITGQVAPTASGTLLNQVWATAALTEVTGTNNLALVSTTVQPAYPDLAAAKAGPATVHAGDPISYTLVVENVGERAAPDVRVSDTWPAAVAFLSQTSPYTFTPVPPDRLTWEVGTLPTGTQATVLLFGRVLSSAAGTFTNTAWATTPYTETDVENNTAAWSTTVVLSGTGDVVINEVAWAGTAAYSSDEWIELYNASDHAVDLAGWTLSDGDDTGITLSGVVTAGGYFLLERSDDSAVRDIPADQIYNGGLHNDGETLTLSNALGALVDTANGDGGPWPAGDNTTKQSMERVDPGLPDADDNWASNDMVHYNGEDANGGTIYGTPKALNSAAYPPPPAADLALAKSGPPTATPGMVLTYTLAITNGGDLDATAVRLTDTLPAGVAFLSQTSPYTLFQPAPDLLVWELGTVPSHTGSLITLYGQVESFAAGTLINAISATTAASETALLNNRALWTTTVVITGEGHVLIESVLYNGYQSGDPDEAVRLVNVGGGPADLTGWQLCDEAAGGSCAGLPAVTLGPGQRIWLAKDTAAFSTSFGFAPDYTLGSWPGYANDGDEAVLQDDGGYVMDAVVFEGKGDTGIPGWSGGALYPYAGSGNFGAEGQILQRILDEATGMPLADTNTRADWIQYLGDPDHARHPLYPGWDVEALFWPLSVTEQASVTVAIAPDNIAAPFLAAIEGAESRIEAQFYDLKQYDVVQALVARAEAGIDVVVLLEGEPAGGIADQELWACQQLEEAGGQCWFMFNETGVRIYDRYTFVHSKVMLVDRTWVAISSQNPTAGGMPSDDKGDGTWGSRGVLLLTDAPAVVDRVAQIFALDWDPAHHNDLTRWSEGNPYGYGLPAPGFSPITSSGGVTSTVYFPDPLSTGGAIGFELFSAPEAALRQGDALLGLVGRAGPGDLVDVEQMYEYRNWGELEDGTPAPNLRLEAYLDAARRGAQVRILLNAGDFGLPYFDISKNLETAAYVNDIARREGLDLQARLGDPTGYGIHNKMVLVRLGGQGYAHIGSINGSETSSKVNREVAVQVRSGAVFDYLEEMFESDWYHAGEIYLPVVFKHHVGPASYVLVSEALYDPQGEETLPGSMGEWVELHNPSHQAVDLTYWTLGDAALLGESGSGRYAFPVGTEIPAHGLLVVVAQAADVDGFTPDFEFLIDPDRDDPGVPNMIPVDTWDNFGFALGNGGDEVILLDAAGGTVDALVYGAGVYPGVVPHPGDLTPGHSLERYPADRDTDDCSVDFRDRTHPTPGALP